MTAEQWLTALAAGAWSSQALIVAAELGLADALAAAPRSAEEIAPAIGARAAPLHRLMRALAALGILDEQPDLRFGLTAAGALLRSDVPGSLRSSVRFMGEHYAVWSQLGACVREGGDGFERAFGASMFDWLAAHPDRAAVFEGSMTSSSASLARAVASAHDFGRSGKLIDVGGCHGELLCRLLESRPAMRGVLADLPAVLERARPRLAARPVGFRIDLVPTDFFERVPEGGDIYLLKSVLHDWEDDRAGIILANVRRAMGERPAQLVVVERVLAPHGQADGGTFADVNVMLMVGGRERSEAEWRALLERAGFGWQRSAPLDDTGGGLSVIVAAPAAGVSATSAPQ